MRDTRTFLIAAALVVTPVSGAGCVWVDNPDYMPSTGSDAATGTDSGAGSDSESSTGVDTDTETDTSTTTGMVAFDACENLSPAWSVSSAPQPVVINGLQEGGYVKYPFIDDGGRVLYFATDVTGFTQVHKATRPDVTSDWEDQGPQTEDWNDGQFNWSPGLFYVGNVRNRFVTSTRVYEDGTPRVWVEIGGSDSFMEAAITATHTLDRVYAGFVTPDLALYYTDVDQDGQIGRLRVAQWNPIGGNFEGGTLLDFVGGDAGAVDADAWVSPGSEMIIFSSLREAPQTFSSDLWVAYKRGSAGPDDVHLFTEPQLIPGLGETDIDERNPHLDVVNCELYYARYDKAKPSEPFALYRVSIDPG